MKLKSHATKWLLPSVLTGLVAGVTSIAYACSCLPVAPVAERFQKSDAVFSGEVLGVDKVNGGLLRARFKLTEGWKGAAKADMYVRTPGDSAACGVNFEPGEKYVVYATLAKQEKYPYLYTNLCSGNGKLSDSQAEVPQLRSLKSKSMKP